MTDEKLAPCSAAANGVLIRLMCILHKQEVYGKVRLIEKFRISDDKMVNFSAQFAKNMPYEIDEIRCGLSELFGAGVIQIKGDVLSQKRMVNDGELSDKRSKSGKVGGKKTAEQNKKFAEDFDTNFAIAKDTANPENENEYVNGGPVLKKDNEGVEEFPRAFPFDTTLPPWTLEACELNQHAITKDKNTEWILQQWDIFILERANDPPAERSMYRQITDLTKYFLNWIRTKTPKKNGAIKTGFGKDNQQLGTSDARIEALRTWGT